MIGTITMICMVDVQRSEINSVEVQEMKIGDKAKVIELWSVFCGEVVTLVEETDTKYIFTNDKHQRGRLIVDKDSVDGYIEWERDFGGLTMAENKTCPFCGSDSIEVYTHYGESAGIQYGGYYPECTVCGCRLNYYDSREEALKAWNERGNHGRE